MADAPQFRRAVVLGTGLIGGSFALALRKYAPEIHVAGWDREAVVREAHARGAIQDAFSGELAPALAGADLVYLALPIGVTLDLLPGVARNAGPGTLITDACSTKARICNLATQVFGGKMQAGAAFLAGHPLAGREVSGLAHADADLFGNCVYAFIGRERKKDDAIVQAFVDLARRIGARPVWVGAEQHDYAVGLTSHLPQLLAVALASFLYDRLDENGLPITLAGPGLRDTLRLAGSPYSTWRDIVLTNREYLATALDLFARRIDDLRERLSTRELEADFDSANELYKLLRDLK